MGNCFEFATEISPGCDHPMVAGAESCTCAHCGSVCTGRFAGCSSVWASGASVLTLLRDPMADSANTEDGSATTGSPQEPPGRPLAGPVAGRHPGKKKRRGRRRSVEPAISIDAPQADGLEVALIAGLEGPADSPALPTPEVGPPVEELKERLGSLEGQLASAVERVASVEAGLADPSDLQGLQAQHDRAAEQVDVRLSGLDERLATIEAALGQQAGALEQRLAAVEAGLGRLDDLAAGLAELVGSAAELGSSQTTQAQELEQLRSSLDAVLPRAQIGDERLDALAALLGALDQRVGDDDAHVEQRVGARIEELVNVVANHAEAGKRRCDRIESRLTATSEGLDRQVTDLTDALVEHRRAVEQGAASQHGGGPELQQRLERIEGMTLRTAADHDNIAEAHSERLEVLEQRLAPTELGLARVNRLAKELAAFMARLDPDQRAAAVKDDKDKVRRLSP